jgi:hypothetical protein
MQILSIFFIKYVFICVLFQNVYSLSYQVPPSLNKLLFSLRLKQSNDNKILVERQIQDLYTLAKKSPGLYLNR